MHECQLDLLGGDSRYRQGGQLAGREKRGLIDLVSGARSCPPRGFAAKDRLVAVVGMPRMTAPLPVIQGDELHGSYLEPCLLAGLTDDSLRGRLADVRPPPR